MAGKHEFWVEAHPSTMRSPTRATAFAGVISKGFVQFWPLLIAPLILISLLDRFPYPSTDAPYSDLTITHYPNALFLLRSLREWGQIPLWSPTILGGYPFAANPLSGLWYPPGWLALLLPLPFGFNLVAALHLFWGGLGMYRLLRSQGLGHTAGLCGALAFEAIPKLFAHYGAGHLTLVYAVPWTPWLLWAWERFRRGEQKNKDLLPGIVLALIFLADVRWAAYAGALWFAWAFAHSQIKTLYNALFYLIKQSFFGCILAAPLLFPFLEYTRLSSRAGLAAPDILALSLPFERLLGLFTPGIQGSHEWTIYPGAVDLALALCALFTTPPASRRQVRFWTGTVLVSLLISLGSQLPLAEYLAELPGIALLRVPSRALFLSGMGLAVLAAYGLQEILNGLSAPSTRRARSALVGLIALSVMLAVFLGLFTRVIQPGFLTGTAATIAAGAWIWLGTLQPGKAAVSKWSVGLLLIAALDLSAADLQVMSGRRFEAVIAEGEAAAAYLAVQPGRFRVYSPSYSIPQQTAARYQLELADGVDPLQLESLNGFMEYASGVPTNGYSVTLPPYASGRPEVDNREYLPDPAALGLLNVRYVLAEYDLPVEGLALRARFETTRVYENTFSRPGAWVQSETAEDSPLLNPSESLNWTPNEIALTASGPGMLVLSEIAYPGWHARVDGVRREIQVVNGILRGVRLEKGEHTVIFVYRPASLLAGLGLSLAAVLFLVFQRIVWKSTGRVVSKAG